MFLPEVAYYATNNPNHVFFFFFLSFLKVFFHTILNKSNNIVSHINFPTPCLVFAFDWLPASISSYSNRVIRRLSFLSQMHFSFFCITDFFVNILQLSFSIIQRNPALRLPRLYDHLLPQLTSHSLSTQTWHHIGPAYMKKICVQLKGH